MTFPRSGALAEGAIPCIEGFCVENAAPQLLQRVAAAPAGEIWAFDDPAGGAVRWDGTSWVTVCVPGLGDQITAGYAAAPDDVWFGGRGALAHWDGAAFRATPAPTTSSIRRVWGNAREAFALDADGIVLRWDGARWSRSYEPPSRPPQPNGPDALWGGGGRAWAVSDTLVEWSGERWTPLEAPVGLAEMSLWADEDGTLWLAGARPGEVRDGVFRRAGDGSFVAVPIRSEYAQLSPAASGPWLSFPGDPTAWRWNGTDWDATSSVPQRGVLDYPGELLGVTPRDAWRAALRGLFHWDGCSWSLALDTVSGLYFFAVETTSAADAWILGWQAGVGFLLWHYDGGAWRELPLPPGPRPGVDPWFARMSASGPTNAWLVFGGDAAVRWDGQQAALVPLPDPAGIVTALFTLGPDETWIAYRSPVRLARWDGSRWTTVDLGTASAIVRLRASGPDDVWALTEDATVLHFDGSRWTSHAFGDRAPISLWTTNRADVWVATAAYLTHDPPELGAATLHHWDGASWADVPGVDPGAITGTGPTDVWVMGRNWATAADEVPSLYHFDGERWSQRPGFAAYAASAARDGELWATDGWRLYHRVAPRRP